MQFHPYEDKEIQYLCGFLVKFDILLLHQTKKKTEPRAGPFAITDIGIRLFMVFTWKSHKDKVSGCGMGKTISGKTE